MGAAVIAGRVHPPGRVHLRRHRLSQGNIAADHSPLMDNQAGHRALRILNSKDSVAAGNDALVADLPPAFSVERGIRQYQLHRLPRNSVAGRGIVHQQGGDNRFPEQLGIADKTGWFDTQIFVGGQHFHSAAEPLGRPGLFPLPGHLRLKAGHIHFQPLLPGNFGGEFRGKTVGVVEDKDFPTSN